MLVKFISKTVDIDELTIPDTTGFPISPPIAPPAAALKSVIGELILISSLITEVIISLINCDATAAIAPIRGRTKNEKFHNQRKE